MGAGVLPNAMTKFGWNYSNVPRYFAPLPTRCLVVNMVYPSTVLRARFNLVEQWLLQYATRFTPSSDIRAFQTMSFFNFQIASSGAPIHKLPIPFPYFKGFFGDHWITLRLVKYNQTSSTPSCSMELVCFLSELDSFIFFGVRKLQAPAH